MINEILFKKFNFSKNFYYKQIFLTQWYFKNSSALCQISFELGSILAQVSFCLYNQNGVRDRDTKRERYQERKGQRAWELDLERKTKREKLQKRDRETERLKDAHT
jgi:hypothetical protein